MGSAPVTSETETAFSFHPHKSISKLMSFRTGDTWHLRLLFQSPSPPLFGRIIKKKNPKLGAGPHFSQQLLLTCSKGPQGFLKCDCSKA